MTEQRRQTVPQSRRGPVQRGCLGYSTIMRAPSPSKRLSSVSSTSGTAQPVSRASMAASAAPAFEPSGPPA